MASGDTKTQQYLDIAANGTRADLPSDNCCNTRTQSLIVGVAERIMDVEDEVEELKNNPDVVDIVATYAALQAYDTSKLTDKDIIRVLQDETHDGQSTYYRYSTSTHQFTYVGTVGDYYTKSQTDTLLNAKQDTLTAGANIQIAADGKTISATDTTYSDFTGTDGTAAGTAGLVPAPAIADAGKFLNADGTWDEVASPITIAQTTGQSTTDVMSQKAVTDELFYNNAKQKIQIGGGADSNSGGNVSSIAIGSSKAKNDCAIAIGRNASSLAGNSISLGRDSSCTSSATNSMAIGRLSSATAMSAVALGVRATATQQGQFDISTGTENWGYNDSNYRLLTGLYDPQNAHDAATKGYVDGLVGNVETALNAINNGGN